MLQEVEKFGAFSSVRELLHVLRDEARASHEQGDAERLKRIYGFASWCLHQDDAELFNPAAIGFYAKILPPRTPTAEGFAAYLTKEDFRDLKGLFRHHYGEDVTREIEAGMSRRTCRT